MSKIGENFKKIMNKLFGDNDIEMFNDDIFEEDYGLKGMEDLESVDKGLDKRAKQASEPMVTSTIKEARKEFSGKYAQPKKETKPGSSIKVEDVEIEPKFRVEDVDPEKEE